MGLNLLRFQFPSLQFNLLGDPVFSFTRISNYFDYFFQSIVGSALSKIFHYNQYHLLLLLLSVFLLLKVLVEFHHLSFDFQLIDQN